MCVIFSTRLTASFLVHDLYAGTIARDMSKNEGMELTMFVDADKNNLTFEFLERYDMGMEYIIRK